jgi:hypothetical protein
MSKPQLKDQACPNCLAPTDGGSGSIDYNPEHPWQFMECEECGASWTVWYSVSKMDDITVPKHPGAELGIE